MPSDRDPGTAATVFVVGSIHLDVQVDVPRLPGPGETVLGSGHRHGPGGKGANQAVAAALAGAEVSFLGRIGADGDGVSVRREVERRGVATPYLATDDRAPTGMAFIAVDDHGANQIAVSPGASGRLQVTDVERAAEALGRTDVLLLQLEVPLDAVRAAVRHAGERTLVVLNPAPARAIPSDLLQHIDVLVPNLVELQQLSGEERLDDIDRIAAAAGRLPGEPVVVVTLGADGALLMDGEDVRHVPGQTVETVDTTGAGDAFCGALASALASGERLEEAVRFANALAANSTTRRGALGSYAEETGCPARPMSRGAPPGAPVAW